MKWLVVGAAVFVAGIGSCQRATTAAGLRADPAAAGGVVPPPPGGRMIWQPGHWHWDGYRYIWVGGHYVERRPHYGHYVEGRWVWAPRAGRWIWRPAHWE